MFRLASAITGQFAMESAGFPCQACVKPTGANRQNFDLTRVSERIKFSIVSAAEIINELPKLTEAELRLVRQRLVEIAAQNEDIALCNQAAMDGAVMLDRMEDDDARRQSR